MLYYRCLLGWNKLNSEIIACQKQLQLKYTQQKKESIFKHFFKYPVVDALHWLASKVAQQNNVLEERKAWSKKYTDFIKKDNFFLYW